MEGNVVPRKSYSVVGNQFVVDDVVLRIFLNILNDNIPAGAGGGAFRDTIFASWSFNVPPRRNRFIWVFTCTIFFSCVSRSKVNSTSSVLGVDFPV